MPTAFKPNNDRSLRHVAARLHFSISLDTILPDKRPLGLAARSLRRHRSQLQALGNLRRKLAAVHFLRNCNPLNQELDYSSHLHIRLH